jgi:hypothetical protein
MQMPASFARRGDAANIPTLRTIIGYHASDDAWVPDMLAGRTMDEVGKTMFSRTVHCSFGDFPARHYLWQINSFRGMRAWDIAKAIGVDPTLPDALIQGLWDELTPVADEWRKIGVFPAAVPVADDAPLMQRLLGLTGRDPE